MITDLARFDLDKKIFSETTAIILISQFLEDVSYKLERKTKRQKRIIIITFFEKAGFTEKLKSFTRTGIAAEIPILPPKYHNTEIIIKKDFEFDYRIGKDDEENLIINIFPFTN